MGKTLRIQSKNNLALGLIRGGWGNRFSFIIIRQTLIVKFFVTSLPWSYLVKEEGTGDRVIIDLS